MRINSIYYALDKDELLLYLGKSSIPCFYRFMFSEHPYVKVESMITSYKNFTNLIYVGKL